MANLLLCNDKWSWETGSLKVSSMLLYLLKENISKLSEPCLHVTVVSHGGVGGAGCHPSHTMPHVKLCQARACKYQTVNQMLVIFHLILDLLAWPSQADWWLHTGYTHNGCGEWWLVSTRTGSAYTTGHHGDNDNACTCSVLTLKCKIVSHRSETKSGEMALGCALLNICGSVYWILPWSLSWWDSLILKSTTY